MADTSKRRWIIRDSAGRVTGPFETAEILKRISRGEFSGDEQVALYPSTDWQSISSAPEFYDKLIEHLEGIQESEARASRAPKNRDPDQFSNSDGSTRRGRAERIKISRSDDSKSKDRGRAKPVNEDGDVIELKKRDQVEKRVKQKKSSLPIFLVLLLLGAAAYLLLDEEKQTTNLVRLVLPRPGQPALSAEAIQQLKARADAYYFYDTTSSLRSAQDTYVQIYEGDNKNAQALMMLCLTYEALWPVSVQDAKDLNAITSVIQLASKINPASAEVAVCRAIDLYLRGKYVEASNITDIIIETLGSSQTPSAPAYYIKGLLLEKNKDYIGGAGYLKGAEEIWPQWLRAFVTEARLQVLAGQGAEAAKKYQQILKVNPKHAEALIYLGTLEFHTFKNVENARTYFEQGLSTGEILPRLIESRAYLGKAEIALHTGDNAQALKWAKASFQLSATQAQASAIIVQLEGKKGLQELKRGDRQLIFEGDQLVREGDCNGAQAYFKQAYELNRKNGVAAMKAAECLWELSLSTDAIEWLNKAVVSEPTLIDAYTLLSEYYSQRFNFQAAAQVLQSAAQIDPRNYKIFRGYALMELKRNSAKTASQYAEQALQLYSADVESHIINARALIIMGEYPKAMGAATKAVELDMSSREAQIVLAEAIFGAQGATSAIDYLTRLTETYTTVTEYRLALGRAFAKNQNYAQAEAVFEQVVRIEEKPKKAYIELAKVQQLQQKFEPAITNYFKAAAMDPSDVEALFLVGILYLEIKKPADAKVQFMRVLRINKEYPRVYYYMGLSALEAGDYVAALELAKQEASRNPNLADPYILLAKTYAKQGQWALCAGEYQKAVKLRPLGTDIMVQMAACYRMAQNLEAASSVIGLAGQQESGNPEVWKEQGLIFEAKGENIRAIEAFEQYLVLAPNAPDVEQIRSKISNLSQ